MQIEIIFHGFSLKAELNTSKTAEAVKNALPLEGKVNVWGCEIYFEVPIRAEDEPNAKKVLEEGELAFWPPGNAFCIFFGPTPVSNDGNPEAYSPVGVFGKITEGFSALEDVKTGDFIKVISSHT